ncbi:acyl-CoA synthetase [Pseudonocardia ailaonensis]|uniref:Acyl-CoA synthetase n=1 Tax=Pseudonocardia ailaonensis TaxID=367279 RepID=A0ABN2MLB6_9PSEU
MTFCESVARTPDKPATIIGDTGERITYRELDDASMRFAQVLHAAGLGAGDTVAVLMETDLRYHQVVWGVLRSGMYLVPINKYSTSDELAYLLADSGAQGLVVSSSIAVALGLAQAPPPLRMLLAAGAPVAGVEDFDAALAAQPARPVSDDERMGDWMLYSSGTTGRPLGIRRPLPDAPFDSPLAVDASAQAIYGLDRTSVFLTPAPLYHSAPLCYTSATHSLGGTAVLMRKFDAERALALVEELGVTTGQWVPSMFVRMLKLPAGVRSRYDLSSQRTAVHGAGPVAPSVKRAMIEWWGPVLVEYYGGTEFTGLTCCTSEEWLAHPGTVGRPILGVPHICDPADGRELPRGEAGLIYFERDHMPFRYHNNPERTEATRHPEHPLWTQSGDIGHLDEDGYVYLLDRLSFTIISGGVNIYPQEIEDTFIRHPAVADVAVFGVPDDEMGERVQAVVQPAAGADEAALAQELTRFARETLAAYKVPRTVDFMDQLPRQETGKLYKRVLRDAYREPETLPSLGVRRPARP